VNSNPPHTNVLYAALNALAQPTEWASVIALPQTRPHRFRVELKLRRSDQPRRLELEFRSEREIADVWEEFNDWYLANRSSHAMVE
jgi:hypothetical protein